MRRCLSLLAVPLLVVVLAACGSSSKPAAAPSTTEPPTTSPASSPTTPPTTAAPAALNACELVDQTQADTVMGTKMQAGQHVANTDVDSCTYAGDPAGPTAQFEVFIGLGAKKFYDDDLNVLQHTFVDVPGVGDESHEEDFNLFFRKGTTWVALRLTSLDEWTVFKPRVEALAKDVASKL
jgi:Protein of unknown function (DUF3558)